MTVRRPVEVVEIDQDLCGLTWGTSPCTAALSASAPNKCHNTYGTCRDRGNYDLGDPLTLRFGYPDGHLPSSGETIFPALRSVRTSPTELNPAGLFHRSRPLGRRASVTIVVDDFPDADIHVDKYAGERVSGTAQVSGTGYDPRRRGTFWGKWKARNPHHVGRSLRLREGEAGTALADMTTRHYFIDRIDGPDRGRVTIVAKDVLTLADNESALAPEPTRFALSADLAADADPHSIYADPRMEVSASGQFGSTGFLKIGSEIIQYGQRSGGWFATLSRGVLGTDRAAHEEGDPVQSVLHFDGRSVHGAIRDLLTVYAGVPAALIDEDGWIEEAATWLEGHDVTAHISEPTGVADLIGELSLVGPYIWWDERAQKVKLRAVRPPVELVGDDEVMTDENALVREARTRERPRDRLSQVYLYHAIDNPDAPLAPENFHALRVATDLASETTEQHGKPAIGRFFTRWLPANQNAIAQAVARNLLARYRDVPREIEITVDAAWRDKWTGDVVRIATNTETDATGLPEHRLWQILSAHEPRPGESVTYRLWPADYSGSEETVTGRYAFVEPDDAPDYDDADDGEKASPAGYIAGADGTMSDGESGWSII